MKEQKGKFTGIVRDSFGNGMSEVRVSDGKYVVQTDAEGRFYLNGWDKCRFITVTVPAGYDIPLHYQEISAEKESYDFVLTPCSETASDNHTFIHISDTEIGAAGVGSWAEYVKELIKEQHPAFLAITGDLCGVAGVKKHIEEMNRETMGCKVRYTMGNHDYLQVGGYGEYLYESVYGPVWYSFDAGNTHYVTGPIQRGDAPSGYRKSDFWEWLKNDVEQLRPGQQVIVMAHTQCEDTDDYTSPVEDVELDLKKYNLIAWVFGHYHYNSVYTSHNVVNISTPRPDCGGVDSSAAGARIIRVEGNGTVTTEFRYYDLLADRDPEDTLWNTKLQGNLLYADTVLQDGCIYTNTVDDDTAHQCGVYSLDAKTGQINWYYPTENSMKNNVVVAEGKVAAMDEEGRVYCLRQSDGALLWKQQVYIMQFSLNTSSAICLYDGLLITGNSRTITALDFSDGSVRWTQYRHDCSCSPAAFSGMEGLIIVNSQWDMLTALRASDGSVAWELADNCIRHRCGSPVQVDQNTLFVSGERAVMTVDLQSGKPLKKTEYEGMQFNSSGQIAYRDGIAFVPASKDGLLAISVETHEIIWHYHTGYNTLCTAPYVGTDHQSVESSPLLYGDQLIFGANDGYVHVLDVETGRLIRKFFAGSAVLGKAVVSDGRLYAGAFHGNMLCWNLES